MSSKILNNISIRKKLFIVYILGVIIPITLLMLLMISQMQQEYMERKEAAVESVIEKIVMNLSFELYEVKDVMDTYLYNTKLSKLLDAQNLSNEEMDLITQAVNQMTLKEYEVSLIDTIRVYFGSKYYCLLNDYFRPYAEVADSKWYQSIEDNRYYLNVIYDAEKENLYLVKSLNSYDFYTQTVIRVDLDLVSLFRILNDEYLNEFEGKAYLVNGNNDIVSTNDLTNVKSIHEIESDAEKKYIHYIGDEYYFKDWRLVVTLTEGLKDYAYFEKIALILLFAFFMTILLFILNMNVTRSISGRLQILNDTMITGDEDLAVINEDMGTDEIGQTVKIYNKMVHRIKSLILEVKSEKVKSDVLLEEKSKAYDEIQKTYEKIKVQSEQIDTLVYQDILTGIKNRFAITSYIEKLIIDEEKNFCVLFLDVDNFKFINDTYGHDLGDLVIKATAKVLKAFKSDDIEMGRFGGDEFLIVARKRNTETSLKLAVDLIQAFQQPIVVEKKKFYLTVSIGISCYPCHGINYMDLIKKADLALYDAKDSGRNAAKLYQESLDSNLEEKIAFQNAVKEAVESEVFYLHYQPYYDARTSKIIGYEALIRWYSEDYGQVSPYKLIREVESLGLIIDLGDWILREACHFMSRINSVSNEAMTISINISMIQLLSHDFYDRLMAIVNQAGISPNQIVLEMTETILIDSIKSGVTVIDRLKRTGFGIALDDFGTGYSSLSYLKSLPVSILKIDKSFVDNISRDSDDAEFMETIIHIAHKRHLKVVAEGVELKEQADVLQSLACDIIQGYYFSRPIPENEAIELARKV